MAKKERLGKGLGALLGEYLGEEDANTEARSVLVSAVHPNPFQPRREFNEEELAELASSIKENGLLQPIVVRPAGNRPGADRWELVAGERRWRAVTRLGWKDVPALVREVDDRTLLVLALVENLQRSGLNALEEAEGYQQLVDEFGLSQQQVAEAVGRDRSTVANTLRLLQLPVSVRRLLEEGSLTAGHARALLGLEDGRQMAELARRAAEEGWSVRDTESRVRKDRPKAKRGPKKRKEDPAQKELEKELERSLGTQVRIRRTRGGPKGRIEVSFYDAEDFERVFELLAGKPAVEVVS
ncbi:MAG: ParB/RepB/Spo0J family partition protein [Gemmatimonadetes bacterium]|nr:ParB/RepB/Spo0J family partition protein [Gemmatimonadota bacterium]NIQ59031.1 ParB/RepB/Spo0J family partition protein [Gemmatimonadota bacterium]NIU79239.1 ParB/RepB/Spo0J family partition protein [Gammaproteobacteria bacterium]NIX48717.1 ParB/RepB/Spo0J family partition protein [Gemmatimonadota bacterium]NIY13168.1 ParB/RepB/Spo0J family partition protein [Gemmatimonadota bacterium]